MARVMDAFMLVRIKKLRVYSPTPEHREAYAEEMRRKHRIEVVACEYLGMFIAAPTSLPVTNASSPVIRGNGLNQANTS